MDSQFRLLAIRPFSKQNESEDVAFAEDYPNHLKVLQSGCLYKIYQNYQFDFSGDPETSEVISIKQSESLELSAHEIAKSNGEKLTIDVSAIVGKNGSGKSTLFDLFHKAMYNLSVYLNYIAFDPDKEDLDLNSKNKYVQERIKKGYVKLIKNLKVELYYQIHGAYLQLKLDTSTFDNLKEYKNPILTVSSLPVSSKEGLREVNISKLLNDYFQDNFFYTIALNYSHHALNSTETSDSIWLNYLFHKNDGYRLPLVINPMRIKGNININVENDLSKQRLLAVLLEPNDTQTKKSRYLTHDKEVVAISFTLDDDKIKKCYKENEDGVIPIVEDCIELLLKTYAQDGSINNVYYKKHYPEILSYLSNKITKICERYDRYKVYQDSSDAKKLVEQLLNDGSHVTLKIKQALNYLAYGEYSYAASIPFNETDIYKISEEINRVQKITNLPTIELLPPAIFKSDITLSDGSKFSELSSGEKQRIYVLSTIAYHLININSIFRNGEKKLNYPQLPTYQNVNILFDEIELYFHPEMQRTFIADIMQYLGNMDPYHLEHIRSINICFSTHSPFILSDIPHYNILKLDKGKPQSNDSLTYGANIHDLLANDFFMHDSFMGEWARQKIRSLIDYLEEAIALNSFLEASQKYNQWNMEKSHKIIQQIGEPLLRDSLLGMFEQIQDTNDSH